MWQQYLSKSRVMKLNTNMWWLAIWELLFIVSPDCLKATLSALGVRVPSISWLTTLRHPSKHRSFVYHLYSVGPTSSNNDLNSSHGELLKIEKYDLIQLDKIRRKHHYLIAQNKSKSRLWIANKHKTIVFKMVYHPCNMQVLVNNHCCYPFE